MKSNVTKNRGTKMTKVDVQSLIEKKKERLAKQQDRMDRLEQTMTNTSNDIEQLEYTLHQMERAEVKRPRIVPHQQVFDFFVHACRVFERLQHRLHRTLNYAWFCLAICARYGIESKSSNNNNPAHCFLRASTVFGYFKRERTLVL